MLNGQKLLEIVILQLKKLNLIEVTSVNEWQKVLQDVAGNSFKEDNNVIVVTVATKVAVDGQNPVQDVASRDQDDLVGHEVPPVLRHQVDVTVLGVGVEDDLTQVAF